MPNHQVDLGKNLQSWMSTDCQGTEILELARVFVRLGSGFGDGRICNLCTLIVIEKKSHNSPIQLS